MNQWSVLALLAVAACSSAPQDAPDVAADPAPGTVVATFHAVADLEKETLTIEVTPTSGDGSTRSLVIPTGAGAPLRLANQATPWVNVDGAAHRCAAGTMVWGADVALALQDATAGAPSYAGLHAIVTAMTPSTGYAPCSAIPPAQLPAGFTTSYGAFRYGTLDPAGTTSRATPWAFTYGGTGPVTFKGVIVGARISSEATWFPTNLGGLAAAGGKVAYPAETANVIVVDAATGAWTYSPTLNGSVYAIATDGTRIWAGTSSAGSHWIETMDMAGNVSSQVPLAGGSYVGGMIADPKVAGRAWFVMGGNVGANASAAWLGNVSGTTVTAFTGLFDYRPEGLAYGPDDRIWITLPSGSSPGIQPCTLAGSCANPVFLTGAALADCSYPLAIIPGPAGSTKLWFASDPALDPLPVAGATGAVCTIDTVGNTVAKVANVAAPAALAVGPDGNVWVAGRKTDPVTQVSEGVLTRLLASGAEPQPLTFSTGTDALQIATLGQELWVSRVALGGRWTVSRVAYLPWQQ